MSLSKTQFNPVNSTTDRIVILTKVLIIANGTTYKITIRHILWNMQIQFRETRVLGNCNFTNGSHMYNLTRHNINVFSDIVNSTNPNLVNFADQHIANFSRDKIIDNGSIYKVNVRLTLKNLQLLTTSNSQIITLINYQIIYN